MSLLHQALKKAEKNKGNLVGEEAFVDKAGDEKKPLGRRVYVLMGLVAVGLLFVVYLQFFSSKGGVATLDPTTSHLKTPLGIAGGPGAKGLSQQADRLLEEGSWKDARTLLEKWVIVDPRNAEAYNNLGVTYKKLGSYRKAYEQYKKALALQPDYPEALNNLGVLYLTQAKFSEAKKHFESAIAIREDYAGSYFHLAMIAEAQGKMATAKKYYKKYIELSPFEDSQFLLEIKSRLQSLESPS